MNIKNKDWLTIESEFRVLVKKYFEIEIDIYENILNKNIFKENEQSLLDSAHRYKKVHDSCGNVEQFIKSWKENISMPNSFYESKGKMHPTNNYIDLANDLGEFSTSFSSMNELIEYSTSWSRILINNKHKFNNCKDMFEYDKILDSILNVDQKLVIDHAFYALYIAWKPDSVILVKDNNKELLKAISKSEGILNVISPRRFEEIIAYLFECAGCRVELTKLTRDFGADILAWHGGPLNTEILTAIQVKKYSIGNNVGLKEMYELHGAISHYNADFGQMITTSNFTKQAINFANNNNFNILNLQKLQNEIDLLNK